MATLTVSNLTKRFRQGTVAVSEVSFDVADREAVFLLGPSGAGKTTTLRLVAGLEDPNGGDIEIAGRSVVALSPRLRNVAMVYDKHSLFPHLSVFENLAYPLRVRRLPAAAIASRIAGVAETLQIGELLKRMPTQLSGGQMQRVAIGRALVRDADVFLMDEPISHLDAQLRARMRVEFKRLQKEFRATILYVSHDQLEAMTMSDRIVVLNAGRVQQIGPPQQIFDRPATRFVAAFVGEPAMNILPVSLREDAGQPRLDIGHSQVELDREWFNRNSGSLSGRSLLAGLRPQHLSMRAATDRGANVIHGSVYAVQTLGSRAIFDVEVGEHLIRVLTTSSEAQNLPRSIGAPTAFAVDPRRLYLFDSQTEQTIAQASFADRASGRRTQTVMDQATAST